MSNTVDKREASSNLEVELSRFLKVEPTEQTSFDIFQNSWSTKFDNIYNGGVFPGTKDDRLFWLFEQIDVENMSVLEFGPLEAGHTFMLERAGAKVVAIEANVGAFLRCLVVKNHLGLKTKFLHGDFEVLEDSNKHYDLIMASGVLYHSKNPSSLICKMSKLADKIFIWTHYFEPDLDLWNPDLKNKLESKKWDLENISEEEVNGVKVRTVTQHYGETLGWSGFCGGTDTYSSWIYKEDLIALLRSLGYTSIKISFDDLKHPHGPAFCLLCERD